MKRWLLLVLCAWILQSHAAPATDDRGVTVDLPRAPQRVVSLLPSLTETVCELGRCDALIAIDDFSNWPEQVRKLPRIGGLEDVNIERVVALKPDVVLLAASTRAVARLQSLGITVFAIEPKTLADVHRALDSVGKLLDVPGAADRVWARMNQGFAQAALQVPASQRGARVYVEVDTGPYAASEISHVGELLKRLGVANIVPGSLGSIPKINPEFVVRTDPQIIIVSAREADELAQRPGWNRIRAVRDGRVCALGSAQGDVVMRPGPRLAEAARILAQCIAMPAKASR
jgi:iron complex transport system substrate-binding protein